MNRAILICLLHVLVSLHQCWSDNIVVSTYNLWNVMFNWETRKYHIAHLIRETDSDIIAFQEVRIDRNEKHSQISELQKLLPEYSWSVWRSAQASKIMGAIWTGWEKEGIGVLSRKPIVNTSVHYLLHHGGPDTNKRIFLHIAIGIVGRIINLMVVHLSYDRKQQCRNAADIFQYISSRKLTDVVIIGDMNIYNDYGWPLRIFTDRKIKGNNPCSPYTQKLEKHNFTLFYDSWETGNNTGKGLTFSNMPTPGYESRPDRILVSYSIDTVNRKLDGNGTMYKLKYSSAIHFNRIKSVIRNSYYTFKGMLGYSCLHDCGPRGSCRCGICVKGGNSNNCELPSCTECDRIVFVKIVLYIFTNLLILALTVFAALQVLIVSAKFNPETFFSILGFTCCLFNPKLYSCKRLASRHRLFRLFNIPPMFLFIICMISLVVMIMLHKRIFPASFASINGIMEEEFYPSDHLMYSVHLRMKPL
ncbi:uncharacterized protein LOC121367786 [Gigantopelta aegis]|uniref:uncharacterized protein LOC121367786 n=1 Tax=Gigantopelta aegis TaxID=1735272 RepID=UPI001B88A4FA|nr:uncharacterized protein LOC121367786 [Gigantopelta aegis]